jgi:hypothetical protein
MHDVRPPLRCGGADRQMSIWRVQRGLAFGFGVLLVFMACEPAAPVVRELPQRDTFIALSKDFQGFRSWGSIELGQRPAQGETHVEGELRAFVNALPLPESREFPVGTIIVKENLASQEESPGKGKKMFAMVKRGGGFNAQGAVGWEWFEIIDGDWGVAISWRGLGAPDGEGYGGDPLGSCNSCHEMGHQNDYVLSKALSLRGKGNQVQ